MKFRVLLIDDHPLLREGLKELLSTQAGFEVCGEADTGAKAREALERLRPDVVVIDLTLGDEDGMELVTFMADNFPTVRILVLSMHEEALYAERVLKLGAHGYLMKHESAGAFITAISKVAGGDLYVSAALGGRLLSKTPGQREQTLAAPGNLTEREREVLAAIAQGLGTQEIAALLHMGPKTVDSHRRNIREKLGLNSATELVRYAVRWAGDRAIPDRSA